MISEGSFDTGVMILKKSALPLHKLDFNTYLYIKQFFKIAITFYNIYIFTVFLIK